MQAYILTNNIDFVDALKIIDPLEITASKIALKANQEIHLLNPSVTVGFNGISIMSPANGDFELKVNEYSRDDTVVIQRRCIVDNKRLIHLFHNHIKTGFMDYYSAVRRNKQEKVHKAFIVLLNENNVQVIYRTEKENIVLMDGEVPPCSRIGGFTPHQLAAALH